MLELKLVTEGLHQNGLGAGEQVMILDFTYRDDEREEGGPSDELFQYL